VLRITIFVNNSYFNIVFGGFSILFFATFLLLENNLKCKINTFIALSGALVFFIVYFILVLFYEHDILSFFKDVFRYVFIVLLFYIGLYYGYSFDKNRIRKVISFILIFHIIIGFANLLTGKGLVTLHGNTRLYGYFDNAAKFGTLLGFAVLFYFIEFTQNRNKRIYLFLGILSIFLLGLNNSLKAIVTLACGILYYLIIYKRNFLYLIPITFLIVLFFAINPSVYHRIVNTLTSSYDPDLIMGKPLDSSLQWRVLQWYQLITDWFHNYPILGAGIGQETKLHGFVKLDGTPYIAHSDLVKLLIETGIVGFLVIVTIIVMLYFKLKKFLKYQNLEILIIPFFYFLFGGILGSSLITTTILLYILYLGSIIGSYERETNF